MRIAMLSLVLSTSYLFLSGGIKQHASVQFTEFLVAQEIQVQKQIIYNTPLNIVLWQSIVETEEGYLMMDHSIFGCGVANVRKIAFHPLRDDVLAQEKNSRDIRRLIKSSKGFYRLEHKDNILFFNDLRFGSENRHPFSYRIAEIQGNVLKPYPVASRKRMTLENNDWGKQWDSLWARIFHCETRPA